MNTLSFRSESYARGARMLRTALGPAIAGFLDDVSVVEVMLNLDGRLWIDRLTGGLEDTGARLSAADGERIVRLVAYHVGAEVHADAPRVSAELPETGERFEGLLPPVVTAPSFAIRKPAVAVFSLADYVASGIMAEPQAVILRAAVHERRNVLVAGGTSTGKTTLVNALLAEVALTRIDRLARSMRDLQDIVHFLKGRDVALKATEQPIDTSSAAGKAFLDMLGVFAEFETNLRRERQMEGIAEAKARGVYAGKGRRPSVDSTAVRSLRDEGRRPAAIARELGISRASVYRHMGNQES